MAINFAAASTAGLNNPGTEIITLVKDGSDNFINPPSYDKIRAYLRSGEVPMLFVTDEAGETGSLYQLDGYSETENKIRFSNDTNAIEFCAGCETPNVAALPVNPEEVAAIVKEQFPQIKEQFVVTFITTDMKNWTCDKTLAEITEAINSGKEVVGSMLGTLNVDFLHQHPNGSVDFGRVFPDSEVLQSYYILVSADTVEVTMASITMTVAGG